jgi:hypothetical protein
MDNNLTNLAFAKYIKVEEVEKETTKGWVEWGEGNAMPNYLIDLYQSSPVHGSLVNSISFMIAGKGFKSENPASQVEIAKLELDSILGSTALDLKLQGGVYWEVIYSMDHTRIVKVNHLPYENVRLAISDSEDEVVGVWYSRDWMDIRKQKNKPEYVPLFNPEDPSPRQVLFFHLHSVGSMYYPRPDYISSKDWIELTRHISEYHVNNILNGFFPSFHINFANGEPSPEAQRMISREIERNLSGTHNAGKFLITFTKNKEEAPNIQAFPITDADKQYEYLSKEATSQIIVAHRVTSPLLMGVRTDGNGLGSNTDEIKAALYVFTKQVIEPFQRIITTAVEEILAFNAVPSKVTIEKNDIIEMQENVTVVQQSAEKKKLIHADAEQQDFTDEQGKVFIEQLKEKAEYINDEWELLSEEDVTDVDAESEFVLQCQSLDSYAKGDESARSQWGDSGLYKLRYAYSQNLSANSRDFCIEMVGMSKAGAVFKYEDIQRMSDAGVNGEFAPEGQNTYDIFRWKGGAFCHHFWKRQIYFRKQEKGRFLPNKGLENDKRVGNVPYVKPKGIEGIAPINRPGRGSLKYS